MIVTSGRLLVGLLAFAGSLCFGQRVAHFQFDEVSGTNTAVESIQDIAFSISNNFSRPERIPGVEGNALRLDGWSTWVSSSSYQLPGISNQITIEAWFVTEAFTARNAGILSQQSQADGLSLSVGSYGTIIFTFTADNVRYTLETAQRINSYQWNHIAATVNLAEQVAKIFVNGEQWLTRELESHSVLSLSDNTFYIGRHSDNTMEFGFLITALNGALDNISVYQNALSAQQILFNFQQLVISTPALTINPDLRHEGDYLRPRYHSIPNTSWTNEPYGLVHYNNKYHLFFQKNPNGPYLYFMHWGHLSSPDLVNWTEEKIPLHPDPGFDDFGVWSGATIKDPNGVPVIYYTGVDGQKAGIGMATPLDDDLITWGKHENNPLIPNPPPTYQHQDFRDPFLWRSGDYYYMIVGSGLANNGGGILFTYRSVDMVNWTTLVPLYYDTNATRSGSFWEMPAFVQLSEDVWMLQVTPIFPGQRARVLYWLGEFRNERFHPFDPEPKPFELVTQNLLAPAFGTDENNINTYLGIIPEDRNVNDQIAAGWRHLFSLPREIRLLEDTTIGHTPHRNLCRLRGEQTQIADRTITPGTGFNLPEFGGNQIELKFSLKADSASKFTIQLFKHEDAAEFTSLVFDLGKNAITLDKRFSTLSDAAKDARRFDYVFDFEDTISVNVFLDHSTIEVFVDQLVVFSTRVYPSREASQKVDLIVNEGSVEVLKLDQWKILDMDAIVSEDVCIPANLPTSLRYLEEDEPVEQPVGVEHGKYEMGARIFPVPASEVVKIELNGSYSGETHITINSLQGKTLKKMTTDQDELIVDLSEFHSGIYLVRIRQEERERIFRMVVTY